MLEKINKHQDKLKMFQDIRVLGLLAFGVVMILITWSGVRVAQTNYDLAKKVSLERQKVEIAFLENENLKLKNKHYESNQFLELAARRQFGRAQAGEQLYMVPDEVALKYTKDAPAQDEAIVKNVSPKPKFIQNLNKWVDFLNK